jgi:hypothetical protein
LTLLTSLFFVEERGFAGGRTQKDDGETDAGSCGLAADAAILTAWKIRDWGCPNFSFFPGLCSKYMIPTQ